MTYHAKFTEFDIELVSKSPLFPRDPRSMMLHRLPGSVQPFLTWLTAKPAAGEPIKERSPLFFVRVALMQTAVGVVLASAALVLGAGMPFGVLMCVLLLGLTSATSGLGLVQVVIFHHCSHGTVFRDKTRNITVGRLISAILLFKHFDQYKTGHMLHHSNNKLLTEEDEFADFVMGMCGLRAGMTKRQLWRRVAIALFSPVFHAKFLLRRVRGAWCSPDGAHNVIGVASWTGVALVALALGHLDAFLVAWVLPVTVLLQVATVFRILCEHRFPDPDLIRARGRDFACHATAGVFAGSAPPRRTARSVPGLLQWAGWWAQMLTVQLLVRTLVLVGDAPCHDFQLHPGPPVRLRHECLGFSDAVSGNLGLVPRAR
jgi:fatty acid desaturase